MFYFRKTLILRTTASRPPMWPTLKACPLKTCVWNASYWWASTRRAGKTRRPFRKSPSPSPSAVATSSPVLRMAPVNRVLTLSRWLSALTRPGPTFKVLIWQLMILTQIKRPRSCPHPRVGVADVANLHWNGQALRLECSRHHWRYRFAWWYLAFG